MICNQTDLKNPIACIPNLFISLFVFTSNSMTVDSLVIVNYMIKLEKMCLKQQQKLRNQCFNY